MGSQLIGRAFLNVCDTFSNGRKISTNTPTGWRLTLKTLSDSPTHQKSSNYAQTNPALRGKWKIYSKLHHQQTCHVGHLEELGIKRGARCALAYAEHIQPDPLCY